MQIKILKPEVDTGGEVVFLDRKWSITWEDTKEAQSNRRNRFSAWLIYCIKEKLMNKFTIFTYLKLGREKDNSMYLLHLFYSTYNSF